MRLPTLVKVAAGSPSLSKAPVRLLEREATSARETATPSLEYPVDAVLRAPSQRLDLQTRDFFERRFGYDFSRVRVHTDGCAVSSAEALNARAYTVGQHIVFGRNRSLPWTESGRSLVAHELAHVVQQQNATDCDHSRFEIGNPSDHAEYEADEFAHLAGLEAPRLNDSRRHPAFPRLSFSHRLLRKKAVKKEATCSDNKTKTWAGCFDTERYELLPQKTDGNEVQYGLDIKISFTPNDNVNAEKIALVQTAQSSENGLPISIYFRDAKVEDPTEPATDPAIRGVGQVDYGPNARDTVLSQMIDILNPAAGTKIDNVPSRRTPLSGMLDPDAGSELDSSRPTKFSNIWQAPQKLRQART